MTKKKQPEIDFVNYLPGHPPDDYEGSNADWMVMLQEEGLWDGEGWYGDVAVPVEKYEEMLEKLEE